VKNGCTILVQPFFLQKTFPRQQSRRSSLSDFGVGFHTGNDLRCFESIERCPVAYRLPEEEFPWQRLI
jgi:hypothetical protein